MRLRLRSKKNIYQWHDHFCLIPRFADRTLVWLETVKCRRVIGNGNVPTHWAYVLISKGT